MPRIRHQPYTKRNPVTCPGCGFEAVSYYNLVRHYALKHTNMIAEAEARLSEAGVVAMAQKSVKEVKTDGEGNKSPRWQDYWGIS